MKNKKTTKNISNLLTFEQHNIKKIIRGRKRLLSYYFISSHKLNHVQELNHEISKIYFIVKACTIFKFCHANSSLNTIKPTFLQTTNLSHHLYIFIQHVCNNLIPKISLNLKSKYVSQQQEC